MKENKTTYEVQISGNIEDLKEALDEGKKALNKLGGSNFASGIDKKMTSVLGQLDRLKKKASRPLGSKAAFSSLENGFSDIVEDAKGLLEELSKISKLTTREKLSLLPEGEAKKYKDALAASTAYDRAVEKAERNRIRQQEKRKTDQTKTSADLEKAKTDRDSAKKAHANAIAKGSKYGDAKAIVEQAEAAQKAQKEIDSLEKQLKKYQKRLEELNSVEADKRTPEWESEIATVRSNVKSIGGKIGARKKVVNKAPDEKTLTVAQKTIVTEQPNIDALEQTARDAEKEVTRLETSLAKLNDAIKNNGSEIKNSQADYKVLYAEAKKLGVSLEGVTEDVSSENVRILQNRMRELAEQGVKPLDDALEKLTPELEKAEAAARSAGEGVKQGLEEFSDKAENDARISNLKDNIKQFIGWAGASKVLSAALRNAFQDIKELDAAMTEIAVVTDFDIGDMWDQIPTYTTRANELGLEIVEVYEASALFYQQGLDTNEMVALSTETLKMAKIAGLDAAEATDRMTAALRGFNMELNETSAQKVADVYSELAAITASDVNEISSAMTKTASIASNAGMEFETTAAFLSQIIETTRESAETAGTAMKTVIARFQELKKDPAEIGEVDGEIVDANRIEGALRSVGVALRDASGQFRNLDDVFLELASKWDTLDTNTQRYIATIAAGSRQQSRFIAMMSNYARTQELVTAANNSAGASQEQYEKTLDSIETKLAQLDNAWTEFSTGLMNSDLVKFAVEFLTSLLNALNKVTQGFGSFTASLSKVGTLVAIFQTAKAIVGKFFDEVIAKIYTASVRAGENIAQGTRDGIEGRGGVSGGLGRMTGYSQIKEGFDMRAEAKRIQGKVGTQEQFEEYRNAKNNQITKKNNIQAQYEKEVLDAGTDVVKIKEAQIKRDKELSNINKELAEIEKHRYYTQAEVDELSKKSFKTICDGAQEAAQSLTVVGVGLGMIGQMFTEMGLEGIGNFFSETGRYITMFGSAMMAIIPIVKLVGTTFKIEGNKIVFAGVKAQAAWWWVFLIVAAVATLAIGISAAVKAAKNNSMEKKFEQLAEGADAAAEAAEKMASSYENLKNSLKGIDDIQTNLDNMVQGTDAWKEAVEELNDEVLKLIKEYPQLAKFVKNEDGVLSIDVDSPAVQAALAEAKGLAVSSQIAATNAQINMLAARDSVGYENLDKAAKLSYTNPEAVAGWAYAGQVATGTAAGAAGGAKLGGVLAQGKGALVGGVLGGIVGAIGSMVDGSAERYAEAAAEAARSSNAQSQIQTEQLAKALAKGDLIDTGGKYELRGDLSGQDFELLYSELDTSSLPDFYDKVGDSTEALKEFGNSLIETETQTSAYYDTIAAQIYHNTDQSGWDDNTKAVAGGLIDGKRVDAASDNIVSELAETDMLDKNLSEELVSRRAAAIQKAYGSGAQLKENDDGGYDIVNEKGETVRANVTSNDLKNLVASTEAQAEVENMAKNMPQITQELVKQFGGTEKENEALVAALSNESGEELTKDQLGYLEKLVNNSDFETKFNDSEILKQAFGSITNFKETFFSPTKNAKDSFNKTDAFFANKGLSVSRLTSGALLGLSNDERLGSLYNKASASELEMFKTKFNGLMNYSNAEEIAAYMNTIDWSNQEDLRRMQYELHEQFGVTEEDAKGLADSMIEANDAMSHIDSTSQVFGALYQATQRVNRALEKTADLQWDYERLLNKNADATELAANLEKQRASILEEGMAAFDSHDAALEKMYDTYANGVNLISGVDLTNYVKLDAETGQYDVSELQNRIDAMKNADDKKAAEEWMKQLVEANELAWDQIDIAKESYEKLEELNEQAEDAYWSLYEQIGDLIVSEIEKEISLQSDLLDATQNANSELIEKLQEQIDADRQARENEKTEQNIADLQNQAAYLGMDSSGANALALLDLEKQIQEEEEAYQDSLIDQSIQNLQDANDKAAEQRERQIAIQEQQLELYKTSEEYQSAISAQLDEFMEQIARGVDVEDTIIGQRLTDSEFFDEMHPDKEREFWADLAEKGALGLLFQKIGAYAGGDKTDGAQADLLDNIMKNTEGFAHLQLQETVAATDARASNLSSTLGFTLANTATKDDTGYTISDDTSSYVAEISSISERFASGTEDTKKLENNRNDAQGKQDLLKKYGLWNSSYDESTYYSNLQKDATKSEQLRSDLATTGDSNLLWHKQVDDYYKAIVSIDNAELDSKIYELVEKHHQDGYETILDNAGSNGLTDLRLRYQELNSKTEDEARTYIHDMIKDRLSGWTYGSIDADGDDGWHVFNPRTKGWDYSQYKLDGINYKNLSWDAKGIVSNLEYNFLSDKAKPDWVALSDNKLYRYIPGNSTIPSRWVPLKDQGDGSKLLEAYRQKLKSGGSKYRAPAFETGGVADFTGPAWLDGTPSRPEYVLNAKQTERFFTLIDVLDGFKDKDASSGKSGDNYFEIEINVEKLENDYDVEKIANKIRSMIYEDATYRNVNAINHIR